MVVLDYMVVGCFWHDKLFVGFCNSVLVMYFDGVIGNILYERIFLYKVVTCHKAAVEVFGDNCMESNLPVVSGEDFINFPYSGHLCSSICKIG